MSDTKTIEKLKGIIETIKSRISHHLTTRSILVSRSCTKPGHYDSELYILAELIMELEIRLQNYNDELAAEEQKQGTHSVPIQIKISDSDLIINNFNSFDERLSALEKQLVEDKAKDNIQEYQSPQYLNDLIGHAVIVTVENGNALWKVIYPTKII